MLQDVLLVGLHVGLELGQGRLRLLELTLGIEAGVVEVAQQRLERLGLRLGRPPVAVRDLAQRPELVVALARLGVGRERDDVVEKIDLRGRGEGKGGTSVFWGHAGDGATAQEQRLTSSTSFSRSLAFRTSPSSRSAARCLLLRSSCRCWRFCGARRKEGVGGASGQRGRRATRTRGWKPTHLVELAELAAGRDELLVPLRHLGRAGRLLRLREQLLRAHARKLGHLVLRQERAQVADLDVEPLDGLADLLHGGVLACEGRRGGGGVPASAGGPSYSLGEAQRTHRSSPSWTCCCPCGASA